MSFLLRMSSRLLITLSIVFCTLGGSISLEPKKILLVGLLTSMQGHRHDGSNSRIKSLMSARHNASSTGPAKRIYFHQKDIFIDGNNLGYFGR